MANKLTVSGTPDAANGKSLRATLVAELLASGKSVPEALAEAELTLKAMGSGTGAEVPASTIAGTQNGKAGGNGNGKAGNGKVKLTSYDAWVCHAIHMVAASNVNPTTGKPYGRGVNLRFNDLAGAIAKQFSIPRGEYQRDTVPAAGTAQRVLYDLEETGVIVTNPCKGGVMVYVAGEQPERAPRSNADSILALVG